MMKLKFTAISPVILSPRMEKALYKDVDFKEVKEIKKVDNIKVVYPLYTYESRDLLFEKCFSYAKEYYIPASSLKGALLGSKKSGDENSFRSKILFQDIKISKEYIELKRLYKFQYLYQENNEKNSDDKQEIVYKIPKFELFFPNVAIEMISSGKEFEGEILLKSGVSEELFKSKLDESFLITKNKLNNYIKEIEERIKIINLWINDKKINKQEEENEDCIEKLKNIQKRMQQIKSRKNIIFLGGYKGILGSLSRLDKNRNIQNGFYIDEETMLPYGLVELSITGQSKF